MKRVEPSEKPTMLRDEIPQRFADDDDVSETKTSAAACEPLDRRKWAAVNGIESISASVAGGDCYMNGVGMELRLVPKGTYLMGGQDGICGDRETTIEHDFYIGVYPVTQGEWEKVMGANPSTFHLDALGVEKLEGVPESDLERFPVESVSWNDCQSFLQKLNETLQETGWTYRLPRDAEWEYACRGAATTESLLSWNYYFQSPTNTITPELANFRDSELRRPTKVGIYQPNSLGIFDMHGTVWEWCDDADGPLRVIRGGSWSCAPTSSRAAFRGKFDPSATNCIVGFRVVRVPSGEN